MYTRNKICFLQTDVLRASLHRRKGQTSAERCTQANLRKEKKQEQTHTRTQTPSETGSAEKESQRTMYRGTRENVFSGIISMRSNKIAMLNEKTANALTMDLFLLEDQLVFVSVRLNTMNSPQQMMKVTKNRRRLPVDELNSWMDRSPLLIMICVRIHIRSKTMNIVSNRSNLFSHGFQLAMMLSDRIHHGYRSCRWYIYQTSTIIVQLPSQIDEVR